MINKNKPLRSLRLPAIIAGQFKTAIPATPINNEITRKTEGRFLSKTDSIIATQIGVHAMIKAAYPEGTVISAIATNPFPPHQRASPETDKTTHSSLVKRRDCF